MQKIEQVSVIFCPTTADTNTALFLFISTNTPSIAASYVSHTNIKLITLFTLI